MQHKDYVSTMQAAKITGLDRTQVFRLIKNGTIPAERVGRNYIIRKKDLFIFTDEVNAKEKRNINSAVAKLFLEYGDVIRKLGEE